MRRPISNVLVCLFGAVQSMQFYFVILFMLTCIQDADEACQFIIYIYKRSSQSLCVF
jgi:hypothetical protein